MKKIQNFLLLALLCLNFSLFSQIYCGDNYIDRSTEFDNQGIERPFSIYDGYGTEFLPSEIGYTIDTPISGPMFFLLPATTVCNAGLFTVHFSNDPSTSPNYGFFNSTDGVARRNVVCQVFSDLSALLADANPSAAGRVHIWVGSDAAYVASVPGTSFGGGVAAFANQFFVVPRGLNNVVIDGEVYKTIRSGQNSYASLPAGFQPNNSDGMYHGYVAINFAQSFYSQISSTAIGSGQIDLYSVVLHEVIHALGFASNIAQNGASRFGAAAPDVYFRLDRLLARNAAANRMISYVGTNDWQYTGGLSPVNQGCTAPNNVIFNGANLTSEAIYNVTTWSSGSSLSHFVCSGTPCTGNTFVMAPCINSGSAGIKRRPNAQEVMALCDLGYVLRVNGGVIAYGASPANTSVYQTYSACSASCHAAGLNDAYTTPFNTPITRTFGDILSNDANGAGGTVPQIFLITPSAGTLTTTGTGFTFTPATGFSGNVVLGYYPRCSGSTENGSLTYVIIAVQNPVLLPCNPTGACNENLTPLGDFEAFINENHLQQVLVPNNFGFTTPVFDNTPNFLVSTGAGYHCGAGPPAPVFPFPAGSTKAIGMVIRRNNGINYPEGPVFQLCRPIPPNSSATITLLASTTNACLVSNPFLSLDFLGQAPNTNANIYTSPGALLPTVNIQITHSNLTVPVYGSYTRTVTNTTSTPITHIVVSTFLPANNDPTPGIGTLRMDNFSVVLNATPLTLTSTLSTTQPCLGSQFTVTYTICNPNAFSSQSIPISALLPAGVSLVPNTDFPSGNITIPALAPGACVTRTLQLQLSSSAIVGSPLNITLQHIGTNCFGGNQNVSTITPADNVLSITKIVSNPNAALGELVTYTIEVCNSGFNAINNVTITDVLPGSLAVQSLNGFSQSGQTLSRTFNLGASPSIGNPTCQSFTFTATVGGSCSPTVNTITNCAQASSPNLSCPAVQGCATINVPAFAPTLTASATTVCSGGAVVLTATGGGNYSWSNFVGNVSSQTVNPTATTTYSVLVSNAYGCFATRNVTVSVVSGGTISASQTICAGSSPSPLVLLAQVGTIVKWQYASDAAFTTGVTDISATAGVTTLTTAQIGTFSGTRYYRAVIQQAGCSVVYSVVVSITFSPASVGGTAAFDQPVCYSYYPANITLTGNVGSVIRWQSATNFAFTTGVTDIPSSAGTPLTSGQQGSITANKYFRAVVQQPGCPVAYSNVITKTVVAAPVGGTASASQSVCVGTALSDLTLTGYFGTITKWQYATNAAFTAGVTDIAGSGSATLTAAQMGSFSGTRYYRAVVQQTSCIDATSNIVTISILPATVAGTASANQSICSGTQPASLAISGIVGNVVTWQSSPNAAFSGTITNISGSAGLTTLTGALMGNLTATTYYRAIVVQNGTGCNLAITNVVTVTVKPVTQATISVSTTGSGCESTTTLTANPGTGVFAYSWQLPDGSYLYDRIITAATPGTYTLSILYPTLCVSSATVTVSPGASGITIGSLGMGGLTNLSDNIAAGYVLAPSLSATTAQTIRVAGSLTIDQDYTFAGGSLIIAKPGSNIYVNANVTLTLNGTTARACDSVMWRGFNIAGGDNLFNPSGRIISNNSTIEDAHYAILVNQGSTINVSGTTFRNNFIGLGGTNGNSIYAINFGLNIQGTFTGNTFTSSGAFMKIPYSGIVASWGLPLPVRGRQGFAGIYLDNFNNLIIGSPAPAVVNVFSNLANGILSINNGLTVRNSMFDNMQQWGYTYALLGYGIYAKGYDALVISPNPTYPAKNLSVTGFGNAAGSTIAMNNCHYGVFADKINTVVTNCRLETILLCGVFAQNNKYGNTSITNNRINCSWKGISTVNNDPYYSKQITGNTIAVSGFFGGFGIHDIESNVLPLSGAEGSISNNNISMTSLATHGVYEIGVANTAVNGCTITIANPTNAYAGIQLDGCSDYKVYNNSITGTNTTTVNQTILPAGILVNGTNNAWNGKICQNTTNNTYSGLVFKGTNAGVSFNGNNFINHSVGLWVVDGNITNQTVSGSLNIANLNRWTGSYNQFSAKHYNSSTSGQTIFYPIGTALGTQYRPNLISPAAWFSVANTATGPCCPPTACRLPGTEEMNDQQVAVLNNALTFPDYNEEQQWQNEQLLYLKMKDNPDIVSTDSKTAQFYSAKESGATGVFEKNAQRIRDFHQTNPSVQKVHDLLENGKALYDKLAAEDSLLAMNGDDEVSSIAKLIAATRKQLEDNDALLRDQFSLIRTAEVSIAKDVQQDNENVVPQNQVEYNEKLFQQLWASTNFVSTVNFTSEQAKTLEYLAFQCPLKGGQAVYKARGLYTSVKDTTYNDAELCARQKNADGNEQVAAISNATDKGNISVYLYPNPAKNNVYVSISGVAGNSVVLEWYDAIGKRIKQDVIENAASQQVHVLQTGELSSGLYHIVVKTNGVSIHNQKLSVIK